MKNFSKHDTCCFFPCKIDFVKKGRLITTDHSNLFCVRINIQFISLASHRVRASKSAWRWSNAGASEEDVPLMILATYDDFWNDITQTVPQVFVRSLGARPTRDCRDIGSARWLSRRN
jgi:hypothetical protein